MFTQSASDPCAATRDQLKVIFKYNGVKADGSAADTAASTLGAGTTGLVNYTTYRCLKGANAAGANTKFGLMPSSATTTTFFLATHTTDAAATGVMLPNGLTGTFANSGGALCAIKLAAAADTINPSDVCKDSTTTTTKAPTTTKKASSSATRTLSAMVVVALFGLTV